MSKLVTFAWSMTVEVPDDFDEFDNETYRAALDDAWDRLQKSDAILTDEQDEE